MPWRTRWWSEAEATLLSGEARVGSRGLSRSSSPADPPPASSCSRPPVQACSTRTGGGLGFVDGGVNFEEIDSASQAGARERAEEGTRRAERAGLKAQPSVRVREARIAAAILAEAAAVDARAIVIGTRGLTGVKSLLLGSVSHAVRQHADRAVVVVPSPEVARERGHHR